MALLALSGMKVPKCQKCQSKNLYRIMARFETSVGIDDLVGKFDKHSRIIERKSYRSNVEKLTPSVWKNRRALHVTDKKLCTS